MSRSDLTIERCRVSKTKNFFAMMFVETGIEVFQLIFGEKKSFSRRLILVMLALSLAVAIAQGIWQIDHRQQPTFEQKIGRLKETEDSLKDLMQFAQDQQKQLEDSQAIVEKLKSEKKKLEPVVESDRKFVDAVLAAQANRQAVNVWMERGIGFVIGTLGSLLATFIWTFFSNLRKSGKTANRADNTH